MKFQKLGPEWLLTNPQGLEENKQVAQNGGSIAGDARKSIEARTGKPVITSKNAIDLGRLISDVVKHDRWTTWTNETKT